MGQRSLGSLWARKRLAAPADYRALYNPALAAVKEALWHVETRRVCVDDPLLCDDCARTGITGPCQVWYLTARVALLRWGYLSTKFASPCPALPPAARTHQSYRTPPPGPPPP